MATMKTHHASSNNRVLKKIGDYVKYLQDKLPGTNRQLIQGFARGRQALAGYSNLLTPEGVAFLQEINGIYENPSVPEIERVLPQLPSVTSPQLHLYKNPISPEVEANPRFQAFRAQFNDRHNGSYRIIQIATECMNNCLMCGAFDSPDEKKSKIMFMPFPMVLLIAKQLISEKSGIPNLYFYKRGDAIHWRDTNFDADFGDLLLQVERETSIGFKILGGFVTHGFWPWDEYAYEAARKLGQINEFKTELSVHLLEKRIFPTPEAMPPERTLEMYAERFALAINLLRPKRVRIYGDDESNPNKALTYGFAERFYMERVLPKVDLNIRNYYEKGFKKVDIGSQGKAFDNEFFTFSTDNWDTENKHLWPLYPSGTNRITAQGDFFVEVERSAGRLPFISDAITVGELYPEAQAKDFKEFLIKLRFYLNTAKRCKAKGEKFANDDWSIYYWNSFQLFNSEQALEVLNREELTLEDYEMLRKMLEHLPVVTNEFYKNLHVADFKVYNRSLTESFFIGFLINELFGQEDKQFFRTFDEGRKALEKLKENGPFMEAIKKYWNARNSNKSYEERERCRPSEEQLEFAYGILKELPMINAEQYFANVHKFMNFAHFRSRIRLGIKANTGIE